MKQLAGSGSVYVRLTKEFHQPLTVTDSSSEDDLPRFVVGSGEKVDVDSSSCDDIEQSSTTREGGDPMDQPISPAYQSSKQTTSTGEHKLVYRQCGLYFENVACTVGSWLQHSSGFPAVIPLLFCMLNIIGSQLGSFFVNPT